MQLVFPFWSLFLLESSRCQLLTSIHFHFRHDWCARQIRLETIRRLAMQDQRTYLLNVLELLEKTRISEDGSGSRNSETFSSVLHLFQNWYPFMNWPSLSIDELLPPAFFNDIVVMDCSVKTSKNLCVMPWQSSDGFWHCKTLLIIRTLCVSMSSHLLSWTRDRDWSQRFCGTSVLVLLKQWVSPKLILPPGSALLLCRICQHRSHLEPKIRFGLQRNIELELQYCIVYHDCKLLRPIEGRFFHYHESTVSHKFLLHLEASCILDIEIAILPSSWCRKRKRSFVQSQLNLKPTSQHKFG